MYEAVGFVLGALAGLIPGLHINTIAKLWPEVDVLSAAGAYAVFSIFQAMFFLSASGEEVGALPVVARALKTNGRFSTYIHHLLGVLVALALGGIAYSSGMMEFADEFLRPHFPLIVLLSVLLLIAKSKDRRRFTLLFLASGILGIISLDNLEDALFIIFSGMFAIPAILWGGQREEGEGFKRAAVRSESLGAAMLGTLFGFFGALLPGISSPSVLATVFLPVGLSTEAYVSLFSSTATSQYIYAYRAHEEIGTSRVGWLEGLGQGSLEKMFLASLVAGLLGLAILKLSPKMLQKLKWLALFLILLGAASEGFMGMATLLVSALLGKVAFSSEVEKTSLLGAILLPTLSFYFSPMLLP